MIERHADRPEVVRAARWVAGLAFISYLLLAFAQQGGVGSSIRPVPDRPLPFDRSQIYGIDLTERSSAGALQWLTEAGRAEYALLILPVDAEIVAAMADEQSAAGGAAAINTLLEPVADSTVALCLRRPLTAQTADQVLETIVDLIRDEFSESIAYLNSCDEASDGKWQQALADALGVTTTGDGFLLPVTSGAPLRMEDISSFEALEVQNLRLFSGETYVLPRIDLDGPATPQISDLAGDALRNAAQLALILVRPSGDVEPRGFAQSLSDASITDTTLVEGFNGVETAPVNWSEGWQASQVGPILYQRTDSPGRSLSTGFVGTSLYLSALLTPGGGQVEVWVDRAPEPANEEPSNVVDLTATQAQDGAIEVISGLPAATHQIYLTSSGGEVAISGFFVSGRPEHDWVSGLASVSLLILTIGALTIANVGRVRQIRRRMRPPRPAGDDAMFERQPRV